MPFSSEDIQRAGNSSLAETETFDLVPGDMTDVWESLENLRLKRDGKYSYWKLRKGLSLVSSFNNKPLRVYGFEARAQDQSLVSDYLAIHLNSGLVKVYDISAGTVDYTVSGFSTSEAVQFHSSGQFLYIFDGDNSKYINLKSGNVSGYLELDSKPITGSTGLTIQDTANLFSVKPGDRALVFPPDLTGLSRNELTYRTFNVSYFTHPNGYKLYGYAHIGYFTESQINSGGWYPSTVKDEIIAQAKLMTNTVYAYDPNSSGNFDTSENLDNVSYRNVADDGRVYFSVSKSSYLTFSDKSPGDSNLLEVPDIKEVDIRIKDDPEFHLVKYASIIESGGVLYADVDGGDILKYSTNQDRITGLDESNLSLAGQSSYDLIDSNINGVGRIEEGLVKQDQSGAPGTVEFVSTSYNESDLAYEGADPGTYYRQYVVIDVLDDGSVCMPGRPIVVKRDQNSAIIGFSLDVPIPNSNVAKRYLCGSRYLLDDEDTFKPTSKKFENSPLFIIRDVDANSSTIPDFTRNETLRRPVTELLPMSAGIPSIFGTGQITPHTISTFESTIAIGGYNINRPTPDIYTASSGTGNLYIDQAGVGTGKTVTILFEYTDGTYSSSSSLELLDSSNELIIHSLNSLVSVVHIYVDDGAGTVYEIDKYQPIDPEFAGLPVEIPTNLSGLNQGSIPSDSPVETVNLSSYVTIPIPVQNVQIASQAKIFGNNSITGIVPLDYDTDRNPLRYRLQVFTSDNIQVGYITEVQQGTIISYNSRFEISDSARRAKDKNSIKRVGDSVFFQDEQGISVSSGGNIQLIIDSDMYPVAQNDLTEVVYNEPDDEIWFLFDNAKVLVFDSNSRTVRTFSFSGGLVTAAAYHDNKLYLSNGTTLCEGESGSTDLGTAIQGVAITRHIGGNRTYTEINEIHVYGNGSNVTVQIDDQPQRERYSSSFDGFDFTPQKTIGPKSISMNGTIFVVGKRGIKPRVGFQFENQQTIIEDILIKYSKTENAL